MKPIEILDILDLAKTRQARGDNFIPLFEGQAGLGKSEICQQWVKKQRETNPNFFFMDERLAYFEPQDMIGLPHSIALGDSHFTVLASPIKWNMPEDAEGLLLFEEPNRGMLSTLNALMQILTDREINGVKLPKGVVIAAVINPESESYDVAKMDAALANRFMSFKVEYDHKGFMKFMKDKKYTEEVISWVDGEWNYVEAEKVANEGKYVSPRSISKLNMLQDSLNNGELNNKDLFHEGLVAILGKGHAKSYWAHVNNNRPVLLKEIKANKKAALKRLKEQSSDKLRTDNTRLTIDSVMEGYKTGTVKDKLLFEVLDHVASQDLVFNAIYQAWDHHRTGLEESGKLTPKYNVKTWLDDLGSYTDNVRSILKTVNATKKKEVKSEEDK